MPRDKEKRSDSETKSVGAKAKVPPKPAKSQPPPRVRTNGGIGNDYYAMLEDDEEEPQNTSKPVASQVQVPKKKSGQPASLGPLKSLFRPKSAAEGRADAKPDEALLDKDGESLPNDEVAMRFDSYIDYQALTSSHSRRERRFLRKFSHS